MLRCAVGFFACMLPVAAWSQTKAPPNATVSLHMTYDTYAAGLHVATVAVGFNSGPWTYQMNLAYHTTGLVGFFYRGHEFDIADGTWHGLDAAPALFLGTGRWDGKNRIARLGYVDGNPVVRQLVPPNRREREEVPRALQRHTIDTLSAMADLIRSVQQTGRCETKVRTYDGRRAVIVSARTVGEVVLRPSQRSSFAGRALECAFSGRMLAGFKFGADRSRDARPMHGMAWLAPLEPGGVPMPVRMSFDTDWFGQATMYLVRSGSGGTLRVAGKN